VQYVNAQKHEAAQKHESTYKIAIVAFYNLENFYDTVHNPRVNDTEFLPNSVKHYTSAVYKDKTTHLATVISQIGTDISVDGPALLGVAEVENDTVLNDLVNEPLLKRNNYHFIHYDSPDPRGIDVALLFNPKYFKIDDNYKLKVRLKSDYGYYFYSRDILYVKGELDGETVHVLVNHWPSRLGGEQQSEEYRKAAALVARKQIDNILRKEPGAKIIMMGDLNDNPVDESVYVLDAKGDPTDVTGNDLYNPWVNLYKSGIGTIAFGDAWDLFDQIMVSQPLLNKKQKGFFFYQALVFNRDFMTESLGKYKGYPMRTWDGDNYRGGYSDHFPSYIILLKKKDI
jgi:hypothetical protein